MSENFKSFSLNIAGKNFTVETGKMCALSNASCYIKYGETSVLVNATASKKPREGIDFFPLSVDFEEKLYAVGKIPGSFLKREGKPSEKAVLASRLIDRPLRPLFPDGLRNDVSIVVTVMSVDLDCQPEVAGLIGSSLALSISDIPFNGPIAGVYVGLIDGELVINPDSKQREKSTLELFVCGTKEKIVMIEAGANEIDEKTMLAAIKKAHETIKEIIIFIEKIQKEIGKEKFDFITDKLDEEKYFKISEFCKEELKDALDTDDKNKREENILIIEKKLEENFADFYEEDNEIFSKALYKIQKEIVREWLLKGKRVDSRNIDEIRPLSAEVSLIPRVHGSGMFTRGQTQVLSIATLGAISDSQILDGIDEDESKRYMHHYNFPSYSVGETRPSRGPGRREIGHGALAERALLPVLPTEDEFPYSIRVVSEVLSSNGSTSQGAVCGSSLALMDAGVPIKTAVAGISCGLIQEGNEFKTIVDIQGLEDFFGDMDFKVAGTKNGITAIQVDIKVDGLSYEIIEQAFEKTKKARIKILDDIMSKVIEKPREKISSYAPKVFIIKIDKEKIRDVIGTGGKVVQKICTDFNVKIEISDNGKVFISGIDETNLEKAKSTIEDIVFEPKIGEIYMVKVSRILNFGAFVEIAHGKEGLIHISKFSDKRVEKIEDVAKIGDKFLAKVVEIDEKGRINLSRKDIN